MSCTVERRVVPELERKDDLRRCSLRARGPPAVAEAPTRSVCSSRVLGWYLTSKSGERSQASTPHILYMP